MADTKIKMTELELKGALLLEAFQASDNRGRFTKYFENEMFEKLKFEVRESFASSNLKGVIRGLHFQNPQPQARIVWCPYGKIWDVIVDLRKNSKTYKKWHAEELSDQNKRGLYMPRGFAHGFISLSEGAYVLYLADAPWNPQAEKGIIYNDAALGIRWPKPVKGPIVSKRDAAFTAFRDEDAY